MQSQIFFFFKQKKRYQTIFKQFFLEENKKFNWKTISKYSYYCLKPRVNWPFV